MYVMCACVCVCIYIYIYIHICIHKLCMHVIIVYDLLCSCGGALAITIALELFRLFAIFDINLRIFSEKIYS